DDKSNRRQETGNRKPEFPAAPAAPRFRFPVSGLLPPVAFDDILPPMPRALPWTLLLLASSAQAAPDLPPGITLVPGAFVPGSQPDGNSIVLDAPKGLIVVDTGRHPEHTAAILEVARASGKPIVAVVNSHWHLDHVGGNPTVRRAFPQVRVYASGAIEEARKG